MTVPTIAWPADVTQNMVAGSYSESPSDSKAQFKPEVGPTLERRRTSVNSPTISFRSKLTLAEKASLDTFWNTSLLQGVYKTSRKNPKTGVTFTGRFADTPSYSDAGPGHVFVELSFVDLN